MPPGPPPLCRAPGSGGDLSVDGCPCDASNDCVGSCNVLTRTCGGIVGALDNVATTIAGVASNDVVFGGSIYDQATVSGGRPTPGGMFFRAFGPDDAICGTTDFFSSHPLSGMGMSMSDTLVGPAAGTWRWIASYAGNAWNLPSATMCNDVLQRVVVVPVLFADGFEQ